MRDLYEDGGAISVRGCRLEPSHRDAGSPTGSSAHLRPGSGERPTCSSTGITGGRYDMGRQSRTHTGLLRPSAWVPLAWIDQAMHTASSRGRGTIFAMRNAPLIGQQTLVDYARGCQSTTHRPLNCRCDYCKRARTEHGSDAADMPEQYEVSRAPRSHTVHIRFSGPSNVHEICPRWTRRRLSWPEPDATRPRSRGLGRASTSPPRAAVAVAVIGRAVVATHVRRTAATTSHKRHTRVAYLFRG